MTREIRKGDLVEVRRTRLDRTIAGPPLKIREEWVPARVTSVEPHCFTAQALNGGAFDDRGHDMIALEPRMGGGKAWR